MPKPGLTDHRSVEQGRTCSTKAALRRARAEAKRADAVLVSAVSGFGLDALLAAIERRLDRRRQTLEIVLKPEEGRSRIGSIRSRIARWSPVRTSASGVTALRIRIAPEKRERLARLAGPARLKLAAE